MFIRTLLILAVVVVTVISVSDARGQTDSRLAVGMSVTTRLASASDASGSAGVGFEWRIGHEGQGWTWQHSFFNWFDTGVQEPIAERTVALGHLRVRPIMAGYGYTWIRGRAAITADLLGGYTLNSFALDGAAQAEYSQRLGATRVDPEATNALAIKPEIQVWYDLNPRFGLKLSSGYLITRPSVVITSSLGQDVRPVRADTFLMTFGLVYSLF
jgi:hypothetical protein